MIYHCAECGLEMSAAKAIIMDDRDYCEHHACEVGLAKYLKTLPESEQARYAARKEKLDKRFPNRRTRNAALGEWTTRATAIQ